MTTSWASNGVTDLAEALTKANRIIDKQASEIARLTRERDEAMVVVEAAREVADAVTAKKEHEALSNLRRQLTALSPSPGEKE